MNEYPPRKTLVVELTIAQARLEQKEKELKIERSRTSKIGQLKYPTYTEWLSFLCHEGYRSSLKKLYEVNKYIYEKLCSGREVS